MEMAERLQDLCKKANYSQEQVSDMLDISRHVEAVIIMMCCGKEKNKQ